MVPGADKSCLHLGRTVDHGVKDRPTRADGEHVEAVIGERLEIGLTGELGQDDAEPGLLFAISSVPQR